MQTLSREQRALVGSLVEKLREVTGVEAVVLGGSRARGRSRPDSDIDLGLLYSEASPFGIEAIRAVASSVSDTEDPVVTGFYEWGPWVNGGAWLTIGGQRVDLLYRSLEQIERVIAECALGRYEHCYSQHGPFGFYSDTFLSDVQTCEVLYDRSERLGSLKQRVTSYPAALRKNLIRDGVGSTKIDLYIARTFARAGDAYGTAATLTRVINHLVLALFALNQRYRTNDKSTFRDIAEFARAPADFGPRVQGIVGRLGTTASELVASVESVQALEREVEELCEAFLKLDASSPAWFRHLQKLGG